MPPERKTLAESCKEDDERVETRVIPSNKKDTKSRLERKKKISETLITMKNVRAYIVADMSV